MGPSPDAILEAAMMLPEEERFALVSRLLESMPSEGTTICVDDPSLIEELDRRFEDREGAIPWSHLRDER
jgi:hypothetical protein